MIHFFCLPNEAVCSVLSCWRQLTVTQGNISVPADKLNHLDASINVRGVGYRWDNTVPQKPSQDTRQRTGEIKALHPL